MGKHATISEALGMTFKSRGFCSGREKKTIEECFKVDSVKNNKEWICGFVVMLVEDSGHVAE